MTDRAIDYAMAAHRPDKETIRGLWADLVQEFIENYGGEDEPTYLTLPGAHARDIEMLIDRGLIRVTETRAIAENDIGRIVALESNSSAMLAVQRKFPGLRIRGEDFASIIRGTGLIRFPEGEDAKWCRARVINLDLNASLQGGIDRGKIGFRAITWIRKICQMHAEPPPKDWALCLTLNASLELADEVRQWTRKFLKRNFSYDETFRNACQAFLGGDLFRMVSELDEPDFRSLSATDQQKILMVFVPKLIAHSVHAEGWAVRTKRNLCYGGESVAPMATWIIRFEWSPEGTSDPDVLYRDALRDLMSFVGTVHVDGSISTDSF